MYRQAVTEELAKSQFDAARLGFLQLLRRKRMSPQFIEREAEDLFAQACFEYSRRLAEGEQIRNPDAWIVTCGWHRTVGLLETRDWRPRMVSTERVGELDEDEGTPEQEFLTEDRYRKVREAVERLPDHQRRLLALSYFEGESVREAARRLGWTASKAQRAHETARRRLHRLLDVEWSDELAIEVGLATFLSVGGGGCARHLQLIGGIEGAVDALCHPVELGHRLAEVVSSPFSHGASPGPPEAAGELGVRAVANLQRHPGSLLGRAGQRLSDLGGSFFTSGAAQTGAAAAEGGGRAMEVCKAIAAACVIGGGAVTGALIAGEADHGTAPARAAHHRVVAVKSPPRREGPARGVLTEGQASEPTAQTAPEASPTSAAPHPVERHQTPEHQAAEPQVKKAKPPPERPEGEFEPSPETVAPAPESEPVVETGTGVTDAARTTSTSTSSSGGGGAKPKPVPANSPEEFEP
jgi:RNA polymerase sigma factor (sigma-70 family)